MWQGIAVQGGFSVVALWVCWYNFARINQAVRMSPAMACGLEQRLWDVGDIVKLIEDWGAQNAVAP